MLAPTMRGNRLSLTESIFMGIADHHCTFCDLIHGAGEVSICYEDAEAIGI